MKTLKECQEFFKNDKFATEQAFIQIDEVADKYAKCTMNISEQHYNAAGSIMGGAIFTLADFCAGVAANTGDGIFVTSSSYINYLKASHATQLTAVAKAQQHGKKLCVYTVEVYDGQTHIATAISNGCRVS